MDAGRPIARTLRLCAVTWLVASALDFALDRAIQRASEQIHDGGSMAEAVERISVLSWSSTAIHFVSALVIVIAAARWASAPRGPGALRDRVLVHLGQGLLALTLLMQLGHIAAMQADLDIEDIEALAWMRTTMFSLWNLATVLLLAGTRAPWLARVGFAALAAAWVGLVVWQPAAEPTSDRPILLQVGPNILAVWWAVALWLAAPRYAEFEPPPRAPSDDPARLRASDGVALLRSALVFRLVLGIASIATLVALRSSPDTAGGAAWAFAGLQCCVAVVLYIALARYAGLVDDALERGAITMVFLCVAVGAVLEVYGAVLTAELFGHVAKAQQATTWGMPNLSELERLQSRALWIGRFASVIGLCAAVALAHSLRRTALWLEDLANARRAWTIAVGTVLAGGANVALFALVQSGELDEIGPVVLVSLAALALALAIWLLVAWLRLLGELARSLRTVDPPMAGGDP